MCPTQLARTIEPEPPAPQLAGGSRAARGTQPNRKIWIDLENSPHVPFFQPIIKELEARDCRVVLTARDCFQVCELADLAGLKYRTIGHHYGKNPIAKLSGLGIRVLQMLPFVLREKPAIAVSHGSRSLSVLSSLLGIPSIVITDYEHADHRFATSLGSARKKWMMTPDIIPASVFENSGLLKDHILSYPGIKEDVYTPFFKPHPSLKGMLGLDTAGIVVTIRPPATEAHYHNPESEKLLLAVFEMLAAHPDVKAILLPRTPKQETELRRARPDLFASGKVVVPKHAVDGLDLIWYSDVVISGGGTMNREAAALGIPVYSLFRGTMGAVDKHLAKTGRLVLLQSEQDVREKLHLVPRDKTFVTRASQRAALEAVVNHISAVLDGAAE